MITICPKCKELLCIEWRKHPEKGDRRFLICLNRKCNWEEEYPPTKEEEHEFNG